MTLVKRPWLLVSSLVSIVLTWTIYHQFTADLAKAGPWGCEMSWMTPSYVEITWEASPMKRYRLFWYREQGWDNEEQPAGLPVIFVPGNAGSYSQVRSIASSASRQFYGETRGIEDLTPRAVKLDFFTVDLNEEFSALHGPTLVQQAAYVTAVIQHVRSLYPDTEKPPVILLGHSMGGIVARLAAKSAPELSVSVILTMATPHTMSPAPIDSTTEAVYSELENHQRGRPSPLIVSVCGGISDTQVVSDACALGATDLNPNDGFTVFTSGLPGAWTAVDHQAMVWCHQIRWAVARALLEAANKETRSARLAKLRRWLSDDAADRQISIEGGEKHKIPVTDRSMSILARSGTTALPRISYCPPHAPCRPVEGNVTRIPWLRDESKPFPLVGEGVHPDDVASVIDVSLESAVGHLELEVPEVISHGSRSRIEVSHGSIWLSNPDRPIPLRFSLHMPIKVAALMSYQLDYETAGCNGHSPVITAQYACDGLMEKQVFAGSNRHAHLSNHIISAPYNSRNCPSGLELDITQDEACPVTRVSVSLALGASLAKAVMRYRMAAVTWGVGWLALILSRVMAQPSPISLTPAVELALKHSWKTLLLLVTGCIVQSLAWDLPQVSALFVGERDLISSVPFALLLAIWTAGLAGMGSFAVDSALHAFVKAPPASEPGNAKVAVVKTAPIISPPPYILAVAQALICLLLSMYLPHQLITLGLIVYIWRAVPRDDGTHRAALARIGIHLLIFTLPFNAVILPVWGRYIWADWRHPFPSAHNVFEVIPTLALLIAVQCGRKTETAIAS